MSHSGAAGSSLPLKVMQSKEVRKALALYLELSNTEKLTKESKKVSYISDFFCFLKKLIGK